MTEDTKKIKKRITEDWLINIPELTALTQIKLYRIVGCTIIGLELINLPNSKSYQPHFVIYPLWKENVKFCLESPSILEGLNDKKGLQFKIPYLENNKYFPTAIECLRKQIPILWAVNITLNSMFKIIDNQFDDILIKSNSARQAKLFMLKFYNALYLNDKPEIKSILYQIQEASKHWNMQMFETWYGNYNIWFQELQDEIKNREEFLEQISKNKNDKLITKLKDSNLIS